jgi:hypothetical protein
MPNYLSPSQAKKLGLDKPAAKGKGYLNPLQVKTLGLDTGIPSPAEQEALTHYQTLEEKYVPAWKRDVSTVARPLLEYGAMIGGGAVGTGASPIAGTVAGAALGYAGGKQVANKLEEALGMRKPKKLSKELAQAAKDVGSGAAMEMGGQAIGKAIPGVISWIGARAQAPGMAEREAISKVLKAEGGRGLTPAELTGNPKLQLIESGLEKDIASSGKMRGYRGSNVGAANRVKEGIIKSLGGTTTREAAGEAAQGIAAKNEQAWRDLSNKAYDQVAEYLPKGQPISTPRLAATADEIGTEMSQSPMGLGTDIHNVAAKLRQLPNEAPATWQGLTTTRKWLTSEISKAWRAGDNFKASQYLKLKNALDQDLADYSASIGGGAKEAFSWANSLYRAGADVFKDRRILANLLRTATPENIVRTFMKPNNVSGLKLLKSAVGEEGLQPLKQSWLENLVSKGEEQSFSLAKFATSWDRYDKATLRAFLKPSEIDSMARLAKVSRILGEVERQAGNPSGTARIGNVLYTGWQMIKNPVLTSVRLIGSNRFAKLYLDNPSFRKYVIQGFKLPPGSPQATKYASQLLMISGGDKGKE